MSGIINTRVFAIMCWIMFTGLLQAQSLEELIPLIDKENLQIRSLEQLYQSSLFKGDQVNELPDPEMSLGLFPLPVETRLGPQRFRIGATQMFPWKGVLEKKEEIEDTKSRLNFENIGLAKIDLVYELKNAYFNLYEREKSIQVLNRNLQIFRAMERFILSNVENGKGSTADVLRVLIKIEESEKQIEILENQREKPLSVINLILNRPLDAAIVVTDTLPFADNPYEQDTLIRDIQSNHPAIRFLSTMQEISQKSIELNELNSMPSFGVGIDYILVDKRTDADPVGNGTDIVMPRGSVRIPLYRKKYTAKEQEEKLRIESLESAKLNMQNRFSAFIDQAITDFHEAEIEMRLYEELIRATLATLAIIQTEYSQSGVRFDELLSLRTDLVQYDMKILSAIVKSHLAMAVVEKFVF